MTDEPRPSTNSRYAGGMTADEYRQALQRLSEPTDDETPLASPFGTSPPLSGAPAAPTRPRPAVVSARLAAATLPSTAAALRRLGRRTATVLWVGVMLGAAALATVVAAVVTRGDGAGAWSPASASMADSSDAAYIVASGLLGAWLVVGGALFVAWLYRMYAQAAVLRPARFTWRPGWAIGGWFVPLLNLYLPYRLTADVSRSVNDGVLASIKIWWTLLVLGVLVSAGVAGARVAPGVADALDAVLSLGAVIGHVAVVCAGLAAVVVVRTVSTGVVVATQRLTPASSDAGHR